MWAFFRAPIEPGWYPVLRCFDPVEGLFPGAAEWDGEQWVPAHAERAIVARGDRCATQDEAIDLAHAHDPEA